MKFGHFKIIYQIVSDPETRMIIAFENSPVSTVVLDRCTAYKNGVAIKVSGDNNINLPPLGLPPTANVLEIDVSFVEKCIMSVKVIYRTSE